MAVGLVSGCGDACRTARSARARSRPHGPGPSGHVTQPRILADQRLSAGDCFGL